MKTVQEIGNLILEIEIHYPELYKYLDEVPIHTISTKRVSEGDLQEYLDDLKERLDHYKETHKPN